MFKKKLLENFQLINEGDSYTASADLYVDGMPKQYVYAWRGTKEQAIIGMLENAAMTIREYSKG